MNYNIIPYKVSVIVLLVLTAFYLAIYALQPDPGLSLQPHPDGWFVDDVEDCGITPCPVVSGDIITAVDDITFEESRNDRRLAPFTQSPGEHVTLQLQRGTQSLVVDWFMPTTDGLGFSRLLAVFFVMPFLVAAGFIAYQVPENQVRNPHGRKLFIVVLVSYALFLVSGLLSFTLLAGASLVSHALAWIQAGTMTELHWELPERLESRPLPGRKVMYAFLGVFALMEILQLLPWRAYYLACAIQVVVPGLMLFWRVARGIAVKPSLIMLAGVILSWLPAVIWMLTTNESTSPNLIYTAFVSVMLLVWPFFYIYANYRQNLSASLEKMGRQWIIVLSFTSLSGIVLTIVTVVAGTVFGWTAYQIVNSAFIGIAILLIATLSFRPFEQLIDKLLYGESNHLLNLAAKHMSENLISLGDPHGLEDYATYFCQLLEIYRCAIYIKDEESGEFRMIFARGGVRAEDVTGLGDVPRYLKPGSNVWQWARVSLPLIIRGTPNGYWLLGARGDDDFYSPRQINTMFQMAGGLAAGLEMRRQRDSLEAQLEVIVNQERMAALGRMAASIAHQINNPLQVLVGSLEAYGGYGDPGLQNQYLIKAH
ncbi:MAG: hypothetical protein KC708_21210, partial [Anaerolineae bacterium]|nr:hypothetical protein [Anaerolineae bacterium]